MEAQFTTLAECSTRSPRYSLQPHLDRLDAALGERVECIEASNGVSSYIQP